MIVYIQVRPDRSYQDALFEINKDYPLKHTRDGIMISVNEGQELKKVLSFIEKIMSRNGIFIHASEIKKDENSVILVLEAEQSLLNPVRRKIYISRGVKRTKVHDQARPGPYKAVVCFIIDDAGYQNNLIRDFLCLPVKIGIAVLPFVERSGETARMIHESGKEVLLHIPMEPKDYRTRNIKLFPDEILNSMTETEIQKTVDRMLQQAPYAAGVNNHQGSSATEDERTMQAVLRQVKMNRLFFIDSMTSSRSVTEKIARQTGLSYGKRDVFLDNKSDYQYIKGQMERLIRVALSQGRAIGIGHVNNVNTFKVLRDYIPVLEERGIQVVFPSEIVNKFSDKEVTEYVKENMVCFN
ncbi:MAG: divergent polysaccharide deacetylase family protein [bacterium]|nr:divergent polysaccharide deacetylase family protein [bacterium]